MSRVAKVHSHRPKASFLAEKAERVGKSEKAQTLSPFTCRGEEEGGEGIKELSSVEDVAIQMRLKCP